MSLETGLKRNSSARFPVVQNPTEEETAKIIEQLRENFDEHQTNRKCDKGRWDLAFRRRNLRGLIKFITENEGAILDAAKKDIGRTTGEWVLERSAILGDLKLITRKLGSWMSPTSKSTPLWMWPSKSYSVREPFGVSLVLGTWNYNITLSLLPVAGALAAGNACVLKPSELAPNQAMFMAQMLPRYVDPACFRVFLGDATFAGSLVDKVQWDFVFFTGSGNVGAKVGESCAKRHIPCALELGGKSPTIIDKQCNLAVTCRRIVQTKFVNCGQTCVAPDYLIVIGDEQRKIEVLSALDKEITFQFGADPSKSDQYGHVLNEKHFGRLTNMMKGGKVFRGGKTDESKLFIEPTIIQNVELESNLMQEEIFGPLLPCVLCEDVDSAIQFVKERPKPLALYVFSSSTANVNRILARTSSGSACVNEAVFQYLNPYLGFGGVGPSGTGSYHGKASFLEFSHEKSVMWRGTALDIKYRYLPYLGTGKVQAAFKCFMAL